MSERIRVTLRWLQILDAKEGPFDDTGEFVFGSKVSTENSGGIVQETRFPENGHWSISEHPAWNREFVDRVLFEGEVDDHLVVELFGEEVDRFSANDELERYSREFRGPVADWVGMYGPGDEAEDAGDDPESMSDWRICYVIERASAETADGGNGADGE